MLVFLLLIMFFIADPCSKCSCDFIDFESSCVPEASGIYKKMTYQVNNFEAYFSENHDFAIWFCNEDSVWMVGSSSNIGKCLGLLYLRSYQEDLSCFSCLVKSGTFWYFTNKWPRHRKCYSETIVSCLGEGKK